PDAGAWTAVGYTEVAIVIPARPPRRRASPGKSPDAVRVARPALRAHRAGAPCFRRRAGSAPWRAPRACGGAQPPAAGLRAGGAGAAGAAAPGPGPAGGGRRRGLEPRFLLELHVATRRRRTARRAGRPAGTPLRQPRRLPRRVRAHGPGP